MVYEMPPALATRAISDISKMLAENSLSHNIGSVLPLDQIVAAHQAVENGPVGKVVVSIA